RERLGGVTHVDGSARLHTVSRESAPRYYALIEAFGERTGVPVVLNTSFNVRGEPMVLTPDDAIRCWATTGLDRLVLGSCVLTKN
ncbi:MAG: carbamoyltransferase C-terminal domain-containing protein, partial [Myxococcota bacterium]|nr:carbamoyltransferase C-terminal domain-containing protein [Myxococcota bacterium]